MHLRPLLPLFALVTACSSGSSQPTNADDDSGAPADEGVDTVYTPPTGDLKADVTRYDYAFDVTDGSAKSALTLNVAAPGGDCFTVGDLLPNADSAQWNGASALSSAADGSNWKVCGTGVRGGDPLSVAANDSVPAATFLGLDVGYSHKRDLAGGTFSYLLSWVGGCSHFGPCDADPSKQVELHFDVTHPAGTTVLCPGVRTATATKTTCEIAGGKRAPTYSGFGLAADTQWVETPFLHVDSASLDVAIFEAPGGKISTTLDKTSMTAFFQWITTLLGPMPYGNELRFGGGPTNWLGFEHPANIILNDQLPNLKTSYFNATTHVFMHETVHQWAGDRTTIATAQDFAWKEATAEYLAYVFEDEHRPPAEAAASLQYWSKVSLSAKHHLRPTDDPPLDAVTFYSDAYGPGPMIFYVQLETMLGRDVVEKAIQSFLSAGGAKSVDDLRLALEAASGKSLKPYFDAWVFGAGVPEWPSFSVKTTQSGTDVTVEVTQKNASGKLYGCAIEVDVVGATSSARALVDFGLDPKSATASAHVTLSEPVTHTTLNPRGRVIANDLGVSAKMVGELRVWIL